jgi:hypothetical protein
MIKKPITVTALIFFCLFTVSAQEKKQETILKREVTLYNPYKPSLGQVRKRSFLPDMNDTLKPKPVFRYNTSAEPFMPAYSISQIKAASLLPDPLPKLYKSYVNIGIGNYITPLAEISITNERSKDGTIGFYGRHFSTNGQVKLDNGNKVFAGYMDNDASVFGRKFFRKSLFESSIDLSQKTRNAYGYDPRFTKDSLEKKDRSTSYLNVGAKASLSSLTLDSTDFSYNFNINYNYFFNAANLFQQNFGINGIMAKSYKGFYVGSGMRLDYYKPADSISTNSEYIISISPFIKKSSQQWAFKLGIQALLDRSSNLHIYPDITFDFDVVPSYIRFFSALSGKLERNDPMKLFSENPYLISLPQPYLFPDKTLFRLPDTDHKLIVSAGLKGNTGGEGTYLISSSYSLINSMLFYSNLVNPAGKVPFTRGNFFIPVTDNIELFNVHAEVNQIISDKLKINGIANYYSYNTGLEFAWNKPGWDGKIGLKYNLKNKIIAGMELTAVGKRKLVSKGDYLNNQAKYTEVKVNPANFNLNLGAEYRYSKILSLWVKLDNIAYDRYYEWAYYPSERFLFMIGFTYSL